MDIIIKKYCARYKIPHEKLYSICGVCVISLYGLKLSSPYLKKLLCDLKDCYINKNVSTNSSFTITSSAKTGKSSKPSVDKQFLDDFVKLLKIIVPGIYSYEVGLLSVHSLTLISRTFLTIYVASLEGKVVKYIVRKELRKFVLTMIKWLLLAIPATFVNSSIRFLESQLSLAFQTRLTDFTHRIYFSNETFYKVANLDSRLENADQCLTDDLRAFSSLVANLYSHITKPLFDIVLICFSMYKLMSQMKGSYMSGPIIGGTVISLTGIILRLLSPKFGELVAIEAHKNGQLRSTHSRVVMNSEEIAFYTGHKIELFHILRKFNDLVQHQILICKKKFWYVMLEQFLMKYIWSAGGMVMIAVPLMTSKVDLNPDEKDGGISSRTQAFMFAKNLLGSGADASERLLSSYKKVGRSDNIVKATSVVDNMLRKYLDRIPGQHNIYNLQRSAILGIAHILRKITELAGYTARISYMLKVFEDVSSGKIMRRAVVSSSELQKKVQQALPTGVELIKGVLHPTGLLVSFLGQVYEANNMIILEDVPIITPNYDVIVSSISFVIDKDMHVLITGPNGCGKSSLFRIIGGLWPTYKGILKKPTREKIFYIPQKPYMPLGTLRDQVIYPDSIENMQEKNMSNHDLDEILNIVNLKHIVNREGGDIVLLAEDANQLQTALDCWDAKSDWKDVLSGGEKQRMGMARIFYHKPQFALLDECTSAVSIDVESKIYQTIKDYGISLLTITHRPSLWKFHSHLLKFDGEGGWNFEKMDLSVLHTVTKEKNNL
ncbi:ATP-binding cassette sub-family D member 2 [Nymphon striatum]|nr:ATP-binding cassette sub-family D member 2 [Nymphon striatum]